MFYGPRHTGLDVFMNVSFETFTRMKLKIVYILSVFVTKCKRKMSTEMCHERDV